MISAEGQRNFSGLERLDHQLRMLGAGRGDFLQILRVRVAFFLLFRHGDGDVAAVFDLVAERLEARFESGDADRRRSHVDAAARLAEIERHTDDANFSGRDVGGACVIMDGYDRAIEQSVIGIDRVLELRNDSIAQ